MDKTKKKQIKKITSWICIVLVVGLLAVMPLLAGTEETTDGPEASILDAQAAYQDIDTLLIGGGTLICEDAVEVTIPSTVKLTEYLVSNGDTVAEGDPIARVDRISIMSAITEVQDALTYLAEEIEDERSETAPEEVTALTGGTVKIVYATAGDSVLDVMLEHGALAVLSLDGLMAVDVERSTDLSAGDTVCVTFSDGTETDGRVESNLEGILTVTVEDDNYTVGQTVKVTTEDGDRIGTGELYIHSQWNATAYSGTVSRVKVSEGRSISSGTTLMTLEDTGNTARYQQLVNQHREYEELMLELFRMYQSEILTAPCDGVVYGVDKNSVYLLSAQGSWSVNLLSTPFGEDDAGYLNIAAHILEVSTDGNWIVNYNSNGFTITDYTNPSGYPTEMNESGAIPIVAVYAYSDGEWVQSSASIGDIILVATDAANGVVWAVKVGYSSVDQPTDPTDPSESTDPTDPAEPTDPSDPSDSADPENPSDPSDPTQPSAPESGTNTSQPGQSTETDTSGMASGAQSPMSGAMSGMGGVTQEETVTLYSLETATVASVTPQNEVRIEITIDELDIGNIYLGQDAMVTVEALSGETFNAEVTKIGNMGTSDGGNAKFTVELTMPYSENMLSNMTASAFITLDTAKNVLTVPVAALNESGTEIYVYTTYDEDKGTLGNPVRVSVGVSDGENAEILSGLTEGTRIYYAYYDTLEISNTPEVSGFSFGR